MAKILKIEVTRPKKQIGEIHLSDGRKIETHLESVYKYFLDKGKEIDEETIEHIIDDYDYFALRSYGINLVGRRFYTEKEIRDKLKERAIDYRNVQKVIDQLLKYDYINDEIYAEKYIKDAKRIKKHGNIKIKHNLMQKGVDENIISKILADTHEELEDSNWDNIVKLCRKKRKSYIGQEPYKIKQKLYQYLSRRGYVSGEIKKAIEYVESHQD